MKRSDINTALKSRLDQGMAIDGTWPNVAPQSAMARPYFEVIFPAADRYGQSLAGTLVRETGRMAVMIVVEADTGEDAANNFASAVSELFPQALRLPITGGTITIEQPADIRGGYRDNSDWRVPIIIRYTALNS